MVRWAGGIQRLACTRGLSRSQSVSKMKLGGWRLLVGQVQSWLLLVTTRQHPSFVFLDAPCVHALPSGIRALGG